MNDMNSDKTNPVNIKSVIAIVEDNNRLKGVGLLKRDGFFEIRWTKSSDAYDTDWKKFAYGCGLPIEPAEFLDEDSDRMVVVGFNTAGTIFNRTIVPDVKDEEIESNMNELLSVLV